MSNKTKSTVLALLMAFCSCSGLVGMMPIVNAVIGVVCLLPFFIWYTFADWKG